MQLYSYIKPGAFANTTVEELERCFREINDVVSSSMIMKVSFQYNSLLMSVQMEDGNTLSDRLYSKPMPDKQLQKMVIPKLLSMIPVISNDYNDIRQMRQVHPEDLNSFWGIRFTTNEDYNLRSKEECSKFMSSSLWSIMTALTFKLFYPMLLPHIIVADSALSQIESLGDSKRFNEVIDDLKKLNYFCENWTSGSFSIKSLATYSINTSDESNKVKNKENLKNCRKFQLKDIGSQYCFLHIKHGDYRIHYFPDNSKRNIHIGYVGAHLPL